MKCRETLYSAMAHYHTDQWIAWNSNHIMTTMISHLMHITLVVNLDRSNVWNTNTDTDTRRSLTHTIIWRKKLNKLNVITGVGVPQWQRHRYTFSQRCQCYIWTWSIWPVTLRPGHAVRTWLSLFLIVIWVIGVIRFISTHFISSELPVFTFFIALNEKHILWSRVLHPLSTLNQSHPAKKNQYMLIIQIIHKKKMFRIQIYIMKSKIPIKNLTMFPILQKKKKNITP